MKKSVFVLLITFLSSTVAYSDVMMLKPCKTDEFRTHGSLCTPCSTTDKGYVGSDPEECSKCKDAKGKPTRRLINGWCVINDCGEGRFQVSDGTCFPCSSPEGSLFTSAKECSKCKDNNGYSIREMSRAACILRDCGDGNFHGTLGDCFSCSVSVRVFSSPEECAKCEYRRYEKGFCYLK